MVRLLTFAEMEGTWDAPGWTALHLYRPLHSKLPQIEVAGAQLEAQLVLQEQKISPNPEEKGPLVQTVITSQKSIPTEGLRSFLEYIIRVELTLFHPMPDLLFDGGEFIVSFFYQGTEITICSSDPPPNETLSRLLQTCQRFRKSIRQM